MCQVTTCYWRWPFLSPLVSCERCSFSASLPASSSINPLKLSNMSEVLPYHFSNCWWCWTFMWFICHLYFLFVKIFFSIVFACFLNWIACLFFPCEFWESLQALHRNMLECVICGLSPRLKLAYSPIYRVFSRLKGFDFVEVQWVNLFFYGFDVTKPFSRFFTMDEYRSRCSWLVVEKRPPFPL